MIIVDIKYLHIVITARFIPLKTLLKKNLSHKLRISGKACLRYLMPIDM